MQGDSNGTFWATRNGGLFFEPIQRPVTDGDTVEITVRVSRAHYKIMEVLFDDVGSYISRIINSHARGLIASAQHNAKRKKNASNEE